MGFNERRIDRQKCGLCSEFCAQVVTIQCCQQTYCRQCIDEYSRRSVRHYCPDCGLAVNRKCLKNAIKMNKSVTFVGKSKNELKRDLMNLKTGKPNMDELSMVFSKLNVTSTNQDPVIKPRNKNQRHGRSGRNVTNKRCDLSPHSSDLSRFLNQRKVDYCEPIQKQVNTSHVQKKKTKHKNNKTNSKIPSTSYIEFHSTKYFFGRRNLIDLESGFETLIRDLDDLSIDPIRPTSLSPSDVVPKSKLYRKRKTNGKIWTDIGYNYGNCQRVCKVRHKSFLEPNWYSSLMADSGRTVEYRPNDIGWLMMFKMGYIKGNGLGKCNQGIVEPLPLSKQKAKHGIGFLINDWKNFYRITVQSIKIINYVIIML